MKHKPIMKSFITKNLIINKNDLYIDATFGQGGHTKNFLKKIKNNVFFIIDKDYESINLANKLSKIDKRIKYIHKSYSDIKNICDENNIKEKINGIFLDLGISSSQIDNPNRGFSCFNIGPLDMRMNISSKITANKLIKSINKKNLYNILKNFGEKQYKNITDKIIKQKKKIETTKNLYDIIKSINKESNYDPTLTFYSIRNAINNENIDLKIFFVNIINLLNDNGRIIILYFNSYEYDLIKNYVNEINKNEQSRNLYKLKKINIKKNISYEKITNNIRTRSANVIIYEKSKLK
ncbi:MAG TPA: 16S rRNA (cytosine(1402)-N(4))-methyltransferase RsmH [Candidatus Azosocius sp. HAIN]